MGAEDDGLSGPGGDERATVVTAVRRWLALGRDVVVRGEDGSGRSRVLRMVLADASRRGVPSVLLSAAGSAPLSALRGHPSVLADRVPATPGPLTAWLAGELRGRRAVLLVDDLDALDGPSAEVVLAALRQTSATLVATTGQDLTGHPDPVISALVAERAPAEERLPPLSFTGVARLLAEVLHAPADVALTSSIAARSGGNPRVALALLDAGRFTGAIAQVDGRWRKVGALDDVPVDAVAHALATRLPPEQVAALELLAAAGTVPADAAADVLGEPVVQALVAAGRLRRHGAGAAATVTVAPPAFATALRARLTPDRRAALARRLTTELGAHREVDLAAPRPLTEDAGAAYWQWSADVAALVQEHLAEEEAVRRTAWQAAPTVARANAYLAVLLLRRAPEQVAVVLAGTEVAADEPEDALAVYRLYGLRWASWCGAGAAELEQQARTAADGHPGLERLLATRLAGDRDGPAGDVLPAAVRQWERVSRAARLLEDGRPDLALAACDADDAPGAPTEAEHHLDGLRAEALIQLGRLDAAAAAARHRLERALDELDLLGIRVHACVLGEALLLGDDPGGAWRVLGTSLRIGPGGPLDAWFYRRTLSVGAAVLARLDAADVGRQLLDELDDTPSTALPALRALGPVARAALAEAEGRPDDAEDLWDAGARYAAHGLRLAALTCWLLRPEPYDPERLRTVREAFDACRAPLLAPLLRLHEALAAGDQDAVVAALVDAPPDLTGLVRRAAASLDPEHAASDVVCALDPRSRPPAPETPQEALSVREREVAALATSGLTNRQIAERLHLSVRTVENHVSNVLRKLGVPDRAALARVLETVARG